MKKQTIRLAKMHFFLLSISVQRTLIKEKKRKKNNFPKKVQKFVKAPINKQ
jgi:hypothetical protein